MSKLREKLLAAVAFDKHKLKPAHDVLTFCLGAETENARLTPLLTALIDCACTLEKTRPCAVWYCKGPYGASPDEDSVEQIDKALAALERAVGNE